MVHVHNAGDPIGLALMEFLKTKKIPAFPVTYTVVELELFDKDGIQIGPTELLRMVQFYRGLDWTARAIVQIGMAGLNGLMRGLRDAGMLDRPQIIIVVGSSIDVENLEKSSAVRRIEREKVERWRLQTTKGVVLLYLSFSSTEPMGSVAQKIQNAMKQTLTTGEFLGVEAK